MAGGPVSWIGVAGYTQLRPNSGNQSLPALWEAKRKAKEFGTLKKKKVRLGVKTYLFKESYRKLE